MEGIVISIKKGAGELLCYKRCSELPVTGGIPVGIAMGHVALQKEELDVELFVHKQAVPFWHQSSEGGVE